MHEAVRECLFLPYAYFSLRSSTFPPYTPSFSSLYWPKAFTTALEDYRVLQPNVCVAGVFASSRLPSQTPPPLLPTPTLRSFPSFPFPNLGPFSFWLSSQFLLPSASMRFRSVSMLFCRMRSNVYPTTGKKARESRKKRRPGVRMGPGRWLGMLVVAEGIVGW